MEKVIDAWDKATKPYNNGFKLVESKQGKKAKSCAVLEDFFKVDKDATN
jgi:hypothetical protein